MKRAISIVGLSRWLPLAARLLQVLGVVTLSPVASARDCSADEINNLLKMPQSCHEGEQRLKTFAQCTNVLPDRKQIVEIRLQSNRTKACAVCTDAQAKLTRRLAEKPVECIAKFQKLVAVSTLLQCLPGVPVPADHASLRKEVDACSCTSYAQRPKAIAASTCEEAQQHTASAQLWLSCPNADRAVVKSVGSQAAVLEGTLCKKAPPPVPLPVLFRMAREELLEVNDRLSGDRACRDANACHPLRRSQLERLALYLDFFATTSVVDDQDREEARRILANVGVPQNEIVYVASCRESKSGCSEKEIENALAYWKVLGSDDLKERALKGLEGKDPGGVRAALEALFKRVEKGEDPKLVAKSIEGLRPEGREAMRRAFDEGRVAPRTDPDAWRQRHERELRRVEVVLGQSPGSDVCSPFVNATLAGVVGNNPIPQPKVRSADLDGAIEKRAAERSSVCARALPTAGDAAPTKPGELGCGSVLGIDAQASAGRIKARAKLVFVFPGATKTETVDIGEFPDSPEEQGRQAEKLIIELQRRFDSASQQPLRPIGLDRDFCGMNFVEITRPRLPAPKAPGVRIDQPDWAVAPKQRTPFEQGFFSPSAWKGQWTGPRKSDAPVKLRVKTTRADSTYRVEVTLSERRKPSTELYRFALVVNEAEACPKDPLVKDWEGRWQVAGTKAAERVVDYFKSVEVRSGNDAVSRFLLPGAEWWDSDDSLKAVGGVAWSVGDVALLGSGVLLVGLSINERNQYEVGAGSLDRAEDLQYVGFGLLAGFLVERVVWAIVGPEGSKQ